jgi:peptide/nickel transport system substrate-binding protein
LAAAAVAAVAPLSATGLSRAHGMREGGTFLMAADGVQFTTIDPALFENPAPIVVLTAACGQLLTTPDKPLPAGYRIVPEIATDLPRITNGGKTYTFTIRAGIRFSTGTLVTARDFAYTLNRIFLPALRSKHVGFPDLSAIVGAQDVLAGKAQTASGIVARGNKLIITLTRPSGGFTAATASLLTCVLPSTLPPDPDGVKAPVPSAGPYYVSEFVPGQRVVLERNLFYTGDRPHHVDRIVVDLALDTATVVDKIERGELDYAWVPPDKISARAPELVSKYGINKSRFFVAPTKFLRWFALNTARPLFRNNVRLRQAVNFALDRKAIRREWGPLANAPTDQYLPAGFPGFQSKRIYPLDAPDLEKARALAMRHTRGGKAVLYVPSFPVAVAQAQIVRDNLSEIGLDVAIEQIPPPAYFTKVSTPGEPFDIAWYGFLWPFVDPSFVQLVTQASRFHSPTFDLRLARASRLPFGPERNRAYGELDVDLAGNAAPAAAYGYDNALTLVSERTGCVVANPYLDLAAVCLR